MTAGIDRRFNVADGGLAVVDGKCCRLYENAKRAARRTQALHQLRGRRTVAGTFETASGVGVGQRPLDVDTFPGVHAAVPSRGDADDAGLEAVRCAESVCLLGDEACETLTDVAEADEREISAHAPDA